MQYKFLVDDHWRVDEQQLCIRDAYGMINNVVFVTEQDFVLPTLPDNPRITLPVVSFGSYLLYLASEPLAIGERSVSVLLFWHKHMIYVLIHLLYHTGSAFRWPS